MKRHIFTILVSFLAVIQVCAYNFEVDGIYYNINTSSENTVSVTYCAITNYLRNEYKDSVIIPPSVEYKGNLYSVTGIDKGAFNACKGLTFVDIPSSVTNIGDYAFSGCYNLLDVTIPNQVMNIGSFAFNGCKGLKSISIPNNVTSIGASAFASCNGLTCVSIPNSIVSVGNNTFQYSDNITMVIISCKDMDDFAAYISRNDIYSVFYQGSELYYKTHVISIGGIEKNNIVIPDGVTNIGSYAFRNCSNVVEVEIPGSVTSISSYAFSGCSGLKSFTIPKNITNISENSFADCTNIKELIYAEGCTSTIRTNLRYVSSVTIPSSVNKIDDLSFRNFSELKSIFLPHGITEIGKEAFALSGLNNIIISNSVNAIEHDAFWSCSIDSITLNCNDMDDFANYIGRKDIESLFYSHSLKASNHSIMIDGIKQKQIVIPNNVLSIEDYAFKDCNDITSVLIPSSVTRIGHYAFDGCKDLTSIEIPSSITKIGNYSLPTVRIAFFHTNTKPSISGSAFGNCKVYYTANDSSYGIPGVHKVYSLLSSMFELDGVKYIPTSMSERTCDMVEVNSSIDSINYVVGPVVKYTNSAGRQYDFNVCNVNMYAGYGIKAFTKLQLENHGAIESCAFYDCANVKGITFGANVTSVGKLAFGQCSDVTSIAIPANISEISSGAFSGCSSLEDIIFEDCKTPINLGCKFESGKTLYLGRNILFSMSKASPFSGNPELEKVIANLNVTDIGDYEFYNCKHLQEVCLSDAVTNIGKYAFSGNSSLKKFEVGSGVQEIGSEAFSDCTGLIDFMSYSSIPALVAPGALDDINKMECTLHVPVGAKDAYKSADQWKEFWIEDDLEPTAIENIIFENPVEDNKLFNISGYVIGSASARGLVISKGKKFLVR